tara:strand:- start:175 stop:1062 length:888 start_codon:yes stop_codon:yes gene_type:complete
MLLFSETLVSVIQHFRQYEGSQVLSASNCSQVIFICLIAGALTSGSAPEANAEINWSKLKGASHFGYLSTQEQQKIGLLATGLKPRFPAGVICPEISSPFGSPTRFDGSLRVSHSNNGFHGGMDITLENGTPLLAAADGKVIHIGEGGQLVGKVIWMQHTPKDTGFKEWTYTKYQHLSKSPELRVGDSFKAGDIVAHSGDTGTTGGRAFGALGYPHLHMNVYASPSRKYKIKGHKVRIKRRVYIDPVAFYKNILYMADELIKKKISAVQVGVKLETGSVMLGASKRIWPVYCRKN